MGKKISQYTEMAAALKDGDLIDVSVDDGGGGFDSLSMTWEFWKASILAAVIRTGTETLASGANVVAFSSALDSDDYTLIIDEVDGVGVDKKGVVKTANGFSIDALEACNINYIAILNA